MISQKLAITKKRNIEQIAEIEHSLQSELQDAKNDLEDKQERIQKLKNQNRVAANRRERQSSANQAALQRDIDQIKHKVEGILKNDTTNSKAF